MSDQENGYDSWHELHANEDELNTPWHQSVIANLDFVQDIEDKRILEIACGRGAFSNYLASMNGKPKKIVACDYSESAVEIGNKRFGTKNGTIEWRKEDIHKLSFGSNSFDTIVSCETIEHLPEPSVALKELYRVLKPGGRVYLTCPNYFNLFGLWCTYRWIIGKPYTEGGQAYVNYAIMPMVIFWAKMANFKIVKLHSSDFVVPMRAHFHFFKKKLYSVFRLFGLQTFYILEKKHE